MKVCNVCSLSFEPNSGNQRYCSLPCAMKVQAVQSRGYWRKRREKVLALLGGKCSRCGIDDFRVLQIDHINGGGRREMATFSGLEKYYKHILQTEGIGYQLLCSNCNWVKKYESNETYRGGKL